MNPVRLLHLSDIHIREDRPGWALADFATKRVTGWCNLALRKRKFAHARRLVGLIETDVRTQRPDAVVFSGDATALGFQPEIGATAKALNVDDATMPPGIAVPGNHDHYVGSAARSQDFETAFAPWQAGTRIDAHVYPFARGIGGVWIIAVNSSRPNLLPWDARGEVGTGQLHGLDQLLTQLPEGPRVLVTHYPYCERDGKPEPFWHGLRDRVSLAILLSKHNVRLWLCGHRHKHYIVQPTSDAPFATVCAGSATQSGRAGYMNIVIDGLDATVTRHAYQHDRGRFVAEQQAVTIPNLFKT